jgi:hypothetical protein
VHSDLKPLLRRAQNCSAAAKRTCRRGASNPAKPAPSTIRTPSRFQLLPMHLHTYISSLYLHLYYSASRAFIKHLYYTASTASIERLYYTTFTISIEYLYYTASPGEKSCEYVILVFFYSDRTFTDH